MRIEGLWLVADESRLLPVIRGKVLARDGTWKPILFLVDTGADATVFDARTLELLEFPHVPSLHALTGMGGRAESVRVETSIRLEDDGQRKATFRGRYDAVVDSQSLDMSVLGRDILNLFTLVVDRQSETVCLLRAPHRVAIHSA